MGPSRTTPLREIFALPSISCSDRVRGLEHPSIVRRAILSPAEATWSVTLKSSTAARSILRFIVLTKKKPGYDGHSRCLPISGSR